MKKILIIGGDNGGGSAGDEIMCEAACDFFRSNLKDAVVFTDAQSENWVSPIDDVKVIKQLRKDNHFSFLEKVKKGFLKLYRITCLPFVAKTKFNIPGFLHGNNFKIVLQDVDVVFFSGCGGLTDKYPINVLTWWSIIKSAKRLNKPVYLSGIGIGPLENTFLRFLVKDILRMVEFFTVRDRLLSLQISKKLSVKNNFTWVPDDAFFYKQNNTKRSRKSNTFSIGVNVMASLFSDEKQIEKFSHLLIKIRHQIQGEIVLIAVTHEDYSVLKKIQALIPKSILINKMNPTETKKRVGEFDLFISARYHGCVFGASQLVPTIGIYKEAYWKNKNHGVFEMLRITNNIFSIQELLSQEKRSEILDLIKNQKFLAPVSHTYLEALEKKKFLAHKLALKTINEKSNLG